MIDLREEIVKILKKEIDLPEEEIREGVEVPKDEQMGDYSFPVFKLAKVFKKAPNLIAEEIAGKLEKGKFFEKIEPVAAYINFFVDQKSLTSEVLKEIYDKKELYGHSDLGKGKTVIVEFSSTNIAKPFHIGHLRSTVIGNSLYHIYKALGYDTIAINHLGDYGTQFGMLIAAFKMWGNKEEIEKDPINNFLDLYVRFNKLQEEDPSKRDLARDWFKKLEDGDEEAVELWQWMKDLSLKEFNKVYDLLGITFDSYNGEAFYSDKIPAIVEELKEKKLLKLDDGAQIVDLEEFGMTPSIVIKSNGTSTYLTRDLAAAKYRKDTYKFYKNIYVVGQEQKLHFRQWKKILELMGYDWANDCIHVDFGLISTEDMALSTRKGNVLFLEDVLNKAIEKTKEIIEQRNPNLENKDEVAKDVGIGAVIFQDLFNQRIKDYVFSWDRTLSFEGETGPYVQYTYARISSLLDKGKFNVDDNYNPDLLNSSEERALVKSLYDFPETIIDASEKYEPFFISRQLIEIARNFNKYYNQSPILVEDEELKKAKLALCYSVKNVIKCGLELLGINSPERM